MSGERFSRQDSGDGKRALILGPADSEEPLRIEVDTDDVWPAHVEAAAPGERDEADLRVEDQENAERMWP